MPRLLLLALFFFGGVVLGQVLAGRVPDTTGDELSRYLTDYIRVGGENQVLDVVRRQGSITRNEVMALLRVSKNTAYNRLRQMVARGKLTKVGNRYYLPSTVVPPEDQEQAILAYLSEAGFAYRQDIARVLRIGPRQCWPILQRMLAEHQIAKDGQKYILLQKEA